MSESEFRRRNNIAPSDWEKSECEWEQLTDIANDYLKNQRLFEETAQLFAKVIQTFESVHSVRWRVKDVDHLLEKIIRKRAKKERKYANINVSNYSLIITDLIGIRALHLFKGEYLGIDSKLRSVWKLEERPIVYLRKGDMRPEQQLVTKHGFKVKDHPAGYRSVHYVIGSNATQRKVFAEIQVRTIFEEGWSEIDHRVRYPNHTDDELIAYFLGIFNRMAGSADEMGSFVQDLVSSSENSREIIKAATEEKLMALAELEKTVAELEDMKETNKAIQASVVQLKESISRLRNPSPNTGAGERQSFGNGFPGPARTLREKLERNRVNQVQIGSGTVSLKTIKEKLDAANGPDIKKKSKTLAQKLLESLEPELDEFGFPRNP